MTPSRLTRRALLGATAATLAGLTQVPVSAVTNRTTTAPARATTATTTTTTTTTATAAATPSTTARPRPDAKNPLQLVTSFVIRNFTPELQGFWQVEFGVAELFLRPELNGTPSPWVAQSVSQVAPTTWQIKLRPNVTFQNGRAFDADAAVALIRRQLQLGGSAQANLPGASVTKVDAATVNIVTSTPQINVPNLLANEDVFPIYDVATVEATGKDNPALVTKGIYTGPYETVSLDGQRQVMKRNEKYWQGRPPFPGIELRFVTDPQARLLAVQNNEADILFYPPTEFKRIVKGRNDVVFLTAKGSISQLRWAPNIREYPTSDRDVRRAINLAIDYEGFANDVMDGAYEVSRGMWPPLVPYAGNRLRTNVDRAKRILDDAGWRMGPNDVRVKNGQPLRIRVLTYPQQPDSRTAAIAVQSMLAKIGVDMEIQQVDDINAAMDRRTGWNVGVVFSGAVGFTVEPVSVMRSDMTTTGPRNRQGIEDVEIDGYASQLVGTFDQSVRNRLLSRVEDLVIFDEAYMTFLGSRRVAVVARSEFKDYEPHFANLHVDVNTKPGA
jgi:peptide/nickel transport system substrate-binding protein